MKQTVSLLACLLILLSGAAQQLFQLAPPVMKYSSAFFSTAAVVSLHFREPGAVIRYTLNGTEPSTSSTRYTGPVQVTRNKTILKAKSFSKNYLPSATVENTFIKDGLQIAAVKCSTPHEKYSSGGAPALINNEGGNPAASANTWLGFRADTINIELQFHQPTRINEVLINFLQDEGSWIFLPSLTQLYYLDEKTGVFELYKKESRAADSPAPGARCYYSSIKSGRDIIAGTLRLQIIPLQHIPDWHEGKGQAAWVFIDEIKVY
jgi:Chitobiase/beta-hexosaminidase C-terminal domain